MQYQYNLFNHVTYFGVLNFGASYLGTKIGQCKTMTKICRFTVHEHILEIVDFDQYLRVTIHTTINWNSHIVISVLVYIP
jgi:hypothetical protein